MNFGSKSSIMQPWLKVSLLLCVFGVMKEFRPSEPFIVEFLRNPPMNFTEEQISQDIYPYSIYSFMISLIFVFLVTDYLRYKSIIVLDALSGFIVYMMLTFCRSLFLMQALEVIYGLFMAGEVAYYTYIYAKVDKQHFQAVTSHTRTAYLIGRSISGIVSQLVIMNGWCSYLQLQMLTAAGMAVATTWALFLPSVDSSIYFHMGSSNTLTERKEGCCRVFSVMYADLKHALTNPYVLKLLVWSVIATAGYYQIITFCQILWENVSKSDLENVGRQSLWNGAVETSYTLLGAAATFMVGKINLKWNRYFECLLSVNSLVMALMIYIMSQTIDLRIAYLTYILFAIIYQASITIVNSEIAHNLKEDSYGLLFGIAMFFSLITQTVLTIVFVSQTGFGLSVRLQFIVYAVYFAVVGVYLFLKMLASALYYFTDSSLVTNTDL